MRTRLVYSVIVLGRRIQPAAFATTLATLAVGLTWVGTERIDGPYENVMGWGGIVTALVLTFGWAANRTDVMRAGLLAAVTLWALVAYVSIVAVSLTSFLLACSWAVLAGGSYWLEEVDARRQAVKGEP